MVRFFHLLFRLALKELKVRYKHPLLGFLWAFIVPFCMILIFMLVFSYFLKVPHQNYPFFVFLVSALFPWNYLSLSISTSTMSILESAGLIKKIYFPREAIPLSIVAVNLTLFIFSLTLAIIFLLFLRVKFSPLILWLPFIVLLQTVFVSGICLLVASLQVRYRDIKYMTEVLLLLWFYLTPVFYPLDVVANISNNLFKIYMLNPLAQLVTFYRMAIIGGYINTIPSTLNIIEMVLYNCFISLTLFLLGLVTFRRQSRYFADFL